MRKSVINVLAVVLAVFAVSCDSKKEQTVKVVEKKEKVETQALAKTEISRTLNLSTVLQPYEKMNVSTSVSGIIEKIYAEVGDKVKKGDMLVRMDQTQYATTKLTNANLAVEIGRLKALLDAGTVSQQIYDQTKVQYDQTNETLELYETNTFVKAKFTGTITAKNFEDGEMCSGQPILTLMQINVLKALINVPEKYFPYIKEGMKLTLNSDIYSNKEFSAVVETVYPTIDANSHTFSVEIRIANAKELLRPGMYVTTNLSVGKVDAFVVPYKAVLKLTGANNRYLFVENNGVAKRVDVELGQRFDQNVEIVSDQLKEGDKIVIVGQGRLVDGAKLEVVKQQESVESSLKK